MVGPESLRRFLLSGSLNGAMPASSTAAEKRMPTRNLREFRGLISGVNRHGFRASALLNAPSYLYRKCSV
jgi:hypothetical protein